MSVALDQPIASLSREQTVDRILALNPSAAPEFLGQFPLPHLHRYLDHLAIAHEPRGRTARWVRPADSPAIVMAETD